MSNTTVEHKLENFFLQFKQIKLDSKEILIRPRDVIDYIYFLHNGSVKQYIITKTGEELNLNIFSRYSYFPMMLVLSNEENKYYFESMDDVVLYKAPVDKVIEFIKSDDEVLFDLTVRFSNGLCGLLTKAESFLYKSAYDKIVSILFYLSKKFGKTDGENVVIDIPITHSDIASWVGIQRETASRQLLLLVEEGVINYRKQSVSVDLEKLKGKYKRH